MGIITSVASSIPVVYAKVADIAGAVVAICNVPGEGDVGAVYVSLQVSDNILGSCTV